MLLIFYDTQTNVFIALMVPQKVSAKVSATKKCPLQESVRYKKVSAIRKCPL